VDAEKCVKCGMCMNCGKKVFDWTEDGPKVARPYNCVVGSSTCAHLCAAEAISFPNATSLRELYKKERIWAKVKKQLKGEGKLTAS